MGVFQHVFIHAADYAAPAAWRIRAEDIPMIQDVGRV
jgi:hypothetical protein